MSLLVCHVIHDLGAGGAEHVLADLATASRGAGFEMCVVSLRPSSAVGYGPRIEAAGSRVYSTRLAGWWDPRGPRRLRRLLAEVKPDIVHSHLKHADAVSALALGTSGPPLVSTLHVIEQDVTFPGRVKRNLASAIRSRRAAMTITVSEAQRGWYLDLTGADPSRVVTIRNGVPDPGPPDGAVRAAARSRLEAADGDVLAAVVAVMRPGKGHDVVLAALPDVDERVRFVFVGDGPLRPGLERRAPQDRVTFTGPVEDVPALLAGMDLLVHPTLGDALPTAVIQAAAAAVPVVGSTVGGVPEVVGDDGGVLVPPGDPAALADGVNRLAADPDARLWMGKAGRQRYEERFTVGEWASRLASLYGRLAATPS